MRTQFPAFFTLLFGILFLSFQSIMAQSMQSVSDKNTIHISKEDFPKDNTVNLLQGWGTMVVGINEPPAGTDYTPLLKGQKDDLCQVPHWGYLEKGKLKVVHIDGLEGEIGAGEVFYMPPGHTVMVLEDARIIDFSPEKPMMKLLDDINKMLSAPKE